MLSKAQLVAELEQFNQCFTSNRLEPLPQAGGVTAYEVVYQEDKLRLLHYQPKESNGVVPLLIIYALVNRPYMTDLQKGRSLIQGLLEQGQEVYLIDWGYPDKIDSGLNLDDYINGYIECCVQVILKRHTLTQINLLGVCQGGVLSLCYSAIRSEVVKKLITMVTPVDFHTPDNVLSQWVQQVDVDQLVDTYGTVSGQVLNKVFNSLKPYQLNLAKYLNVVSTLDKQELMESFILMEQWINDSPDLAGEALRQFLKDFFQQNKLIKGEVVVGKHPVNLQNITMPLLNIYATEDHIVPPAASKVLGMLIGGEYEEFSFKGGHIGIYVSSKAQTQVPPKIANWLKNHS